MKLRLFKPQLRTQKQLRATPKLARPRVLGIGARLRTAISSVARTAMPDGLRRGPGKHWLNKPDITVRDDGREICNPVTEGGRAEYAWRVLLMWIRQDGKCCNCRQELSLAEATFEHEHGRTSGKRDDRIAIFNLQSGRLERHQNGASHEWCNVKRGSRRTPIWHGNNCIEEAA